MPFVPRKDVPVVNRPATLKHSCPPQSAEVDDKSTCTSCACAGAVNDRTSQAAASNRKGRAKEFFVVIIPLPSIDLPFNDACSRNAQGAMPSQTAIPLESYPARNPEVSRVVVLVWTNSAKARPVTMFASLVAHRRRRPIGWRGVWPAQQH